MATIEISLVVEYDQEIPTDPDASTMADEITGFIRDEYRGLADASRFPGVTVTECEVKSILEPIEEGPDDLA